jgi:hypothetical protein
MKKPAIGDPAAFLDKLPVHQGDLRRWPPE